MLPTILINSNLNYTIFYDAVQKIIYLKKIIGKSCIGVLKFHTIAPDTYKNNSIAHREINWFSNLQSGTRQIIWCSFFVIDIIPQQLLSNNPKIKT